MRHFFSKLLAFINGFCKFGFDFVLTFDPGVVCDPPNLSKGIDGFKDLNFVQLVERFNLE